MTAPTRSNGAAARAQNGSCMIVKQIRVLNSIPTYWISCMKSLVSIANDPWMCSSAMPWEYHKARFEILKRHRDHVRKCESQFAQNRTKHTASQELLQSSQKQLNAAQTAGQAVEDSQADYERYLQADETLKRLRQDERKRNALHKQQSDLHGTRATHRAHISNLQSRLDEVATARQRLGDLLPLVEQPYKLEKQ